MWTPWTWLRSKAKEAILGGVADALAEVAPNGEPPPLTLEMLQQRLSAPALADREPEADTAPETAARGRKGK